jgi:hypothetical protein
MTRDIIYSIAALIGLQVIGFWCWRIDERIDKAEARMTARFDELAKEMRESIRKESYILENLDNLKGRL